MVVEDLELQTMQKIARLLAKLEESAKRRVVAWLTEKMRDDDDVVLPS